MKKRLWFNTLSLQRDHRKEHGKCSMAQGHSKHGKF